MSEHLLFITGKLAEKQLRNILEKMQPDFTYTVHQLGLKVAALMTADMIARRLTDTFGADRIIVPGRCRGNLEALSKDLKLPVIRGPEELKDLPMFFGKAAQKLDLSRYSVKIFAEIVDAPNVSVEEVLRRADYYRKNGADVIDIGCLPSTDFPHLEDTIGALKQQGFTVSIDSLEAVDLLRGGKAGADYLLSLHESTLWVADEVAATPIIIPERHEDLASLDRAIKIMQAKNRAFIVDPILDPLHFGFTQSIVRYHQVRKNHPDIEMMLGVGNITELTHADTAGMNTLLLGICSELNINHILATEVSRHACRSIKEADLARRILFAAKEHDMLPKHIDPGLMALHETAPFPYSLEEITELAGQIRDPSFRVQISAEGVHIFNRDGLHSATDPFELFPKLQLENDSSHAFYLGVELARAEIAWQLGKRYTQDQALNWGCATANTEITVDLHSFKPAGTTLKKPSTTSK
jgi:dihydropteroate synthase-like protein